MNNGIYKFSEVDINSNNIGGKARNLALLTQNGFPVPEGFVVSTKAFDDNKLSEESISIIKSLIDNNSLYAVRSSAMVEDATNESWAGQFESYLNVKPKDIINKIYECHNSKKDRAVSYANGEYDQGYCITKEYVGDAKEYCRITPGEDLLYNGRCLERKTTINGGCINGDKLINGYCYDTGANSGYKADWVCPDGTFITNPDGSLINEDKKCYKETKSKPTSYYCEDNATLEKDKCVNKQIEDPEKERVCPTEYTKVDYDRCINKDKTIAKENGLVCNGDNTKLKEETCVVYEIIEAKSY